MGAELLRLHWDSELFGTTGVGLAWDVELGDAGAAVGRALRGLGPGVGDVADHGSLVSVVLPVRNGRRYVGDAIESITNQTLERLQLLIVDDGSTDGSSEIVADWARRDSRIRVIQGPSTGLSDALNEAVLHVDTALIARMDADDISLPNRLAIQVDFLERHPAVAAVGGGIDYMTEDGRIEFWFDPLHLEPPARTPFVSHHWIPHPTLVARTEALRAVRGYRPAFKIAQDLDLWMRLIDAGYVLDSVPAPVLLYRRHQSQLTADTTMTHIETVAAFASRELRRCGLPDPFDPPVVDVAATLLGPHRDANDVLTVARRIMLEVADSSVRNAAHLPTKTLQRIQRIAKTSPWLASWIRAQLLAAARTASRDGRGVKAVWLGLQARRWQRAGARRPGKVMIGR